MSHIRSSNTKPEEMVRKALFAAGFRYRKNAKGLPGHPDILLPKYKVVVFVNGCFWHGHEGCRYFTHPKTNAEFWNNKVERNRQRDAEVNNKLAALGWNMITIWECETKRGVFDSTIERLIKQIAESENQKFK